MADSAIQNTPTGTGTDPETPKMKTTKLQGFIAAFAVLAFIGFIFLLTFLACDIIYIPYLSEFAHFLALIISPFVPFLFPGLLGVFLKVCQHKNWPKKKTWVLITASWVFQHVQRAITDAIKLWGHGNVCGLRECKGKWVEWALVLVVVLCQIGGWKWDNGYVDRWIDTLIIEEAEKKAKEDAEKIAKGEMPAEIDLEKADNFESVEYKDAEAEKRELKAREEMVVEEQKQNLVEVEEKA